MSGQMSVEELHRVLDTVRDGDVIEYLLSDHFHRGPASWSGGSVFCWAMLRHSNGDLPADLTSVRVVERARPDWAADDVAMIEADGDIFCRISPDRPWQSRHYVRDTDQMTERLAGSDVRVVARFEQVQP